MKRHVKKLLASLLTGAMLVTSAMPVSAAETSAMTSAPLAVSNFSGVKFSEISDGTWAAISEALADTAAKSAFGAKVGKYSTEAVKDAIFEAIFVDRDSNRVNFETLGLSAGDVEALTAEVLAEMNAEEAVAYAVGSDNEGNATVMAVEIDPLYETAYEEIETALGIEDEISTSSDGEKVIVISEDDVIEAAEDEEPTMEDAIAAFNSYQQFIDDNPDYFGITVPYTSVKDDENEGGGPITSLVTIANEKVDYNGDGVVDENDNGVTLLDLFKMGYVPASDLIQIIQMFDMGNQLAVNLLGEELLASKDDALNAVPSDATDEQRFLALNDWLADRATFDMASIMELEAPEPTTPDIYNTLVYALQQYGLSDAEIEQLAPQVLGLWGGTQFGVLCESMGYTGVCMGYTYAYAYLVQWEFDEVYKDGGSWRTRTELNYIENPEKVVDEVAVVAAEDNETPVDPADGEDGECTEHVDTDANGLCDTCGTAVETEEPECTEHVDADADGLCDTCGTAVETEEPECTEHVDADADGLCDTCGATVETTPTHTHTYAETATWEWAEDNSSATATLACTDAECDGSEGATLTATATPVKVEEESVAATCTATGKDVYTATAELNGTTFTDKKEVETATIAHDFGEDGLAEECAVCGATNVDILPDYIWDPSADALVDYVRITYDADVTLYGEEQDAFESDHYWNAVKVNGQWYYVDPCYTDIYIECMVRDRVETDGNINHLYFMFSHTSTVSLYEGNYQSIDTLYDDIATDTTYEDAWFAFAKSPVYFDGDVAYYYYDATDLIDLMESNSGSSFGTSADYSDYGAETDYRIVSHNLSAADTGTDFTTLIDFTADDENEDTVLVQVRDANGKLVDNEMLTELYAEHLDYQEKYPSIDISCDKEGSKIYFNISNCIMYYDLETCEVVKLYEYNEVTAERDLSKGLGGMAFTVIDPEDAVEPEEGAELTTHTVKNNPIASMTIKNGNMYVSIGTTIAFISGRESMEEDDSIGYQFEETNFNPDYTAQSQTSSNYGSEEENDNDEFMWSANFVDIIPVSDLSCSHETYEEVEIPATCGENAYTENRCADCGAIEADSRVDVEGTAVDHHYIRFDETYYTKNNGNEPNTGTSYVCTECKDAKDALEDGDHLGHEYVGTATWNDVYTEATMDAVCGTCYGVNYDCLLGDETISYEGSEATVTKAKSEVVNEETGETEYYTTYTATATVNGKKCSDSIKVQYPFCDIEKSDFFYDAVLWAVDNKITSGYTAPGEIGKFGPNDKCTRAQAVTFMWRAEGEPETTAKNTFPDVEEDMFYTTPVLWAVEKGIVKGYEKGPDAGKFGTNDTCTRGQIVTLLYRLAGEPAISEDTVNEFPDVIEGEYYYDAVLWAYENRIAKGYTADGPDKGKFGPNDKCTRGHIVTFLYRYYNPDAIEEN